MVKFFIIYCTVPVIQAWVLRYITLELDGYKWQHIITCYSHPLQVYENLYNAVVSIPGAQQRPHWWKAVVECTEIINPQHTKAKL